MLRNGGRLLPPTLESRALVAYATQPKEKVTGVMDLPANWATALCTISGPRINKTVKMSFGFRHCPDKSPTEFAMSVPLAKSRFGSEERGQVGGMRTTFNL